MHESKPFSFFNSFILFFDIFQYIYIYKCISLTEVNQMQEKFEIENAQDVKNVIEVLCPNEALEITDKDGVVYHIQKCVNVERGVAVSVGGFQVYCTDIQVWNDSVLKFRDEEVLVGTLRDVDKLSYGICDMDRQ